jgi:hypothetical protein
VIGRNPLLPLPPSWLDELDVEMITMEGGLKPGEGTGS